MSAKIPAFTDIGKATRELLNGGANGVFQYGQIATLSSKTADGLEFVATTAKKDDKVEAALKAVYSYKNVKGAMTFTNSGKVATALTFSDVAPGLSATLSGTLPDLQSAKLGIDYTVPHLTLKSTIGLTAAPTVDIAATTGYQDMVFGGAATFETAKNNALSKWSFGAGYTKLDYQVAALLTDMGETAKLSYAHNIDPTTTAGAEVVKSLKSEATPTVITLGYQKRLENGSLAKVKLDNQGILGILYEQDLQPKTKVAIATQFDATNLEKPPKVGVALDVKN